MKSWAIQFKPSTIERELWGARDVRIFDVPYWRGPAELVHLLSVVSPVADDLAIFATGYNIPPFVPRRSISLMKRSNRYRESCGPGADSGWY